MKWSVAFVTSVLIHGLVFAFLCLWFSVEKMGRGSPNPNRPLQLSLQQATPPIKPSPSMPSAVLSQLSASDFKLPEPVLPEPTLSPEKPKEVADKPIPDPVLASDLPSTDPDKSDLSDQIVPATMPDEGVRHLPPSLSYKEHDAETTEGWGMSGAAPYVYLPSEKLDKVTMPLQEISLSMPESLSQDISQAKLEIRVYINKEGKVDAVEVVSASPPGVLEYLARETFSLAEFETGTFKGTAVAYYKNIEIILK